MNKNELHGGARYLGGKVEKAVGDAVGSREWQVDGVVDQVAGGAENLYGRARGIAEDAVDAAPGFVDEAKERLGDAADRTRDIADRAGDAAARGTRAANAAVSNNPASWAVFAALGAGIGGYLLGWLIDGERA